MANPPITRFTSLAVSTAQNSGNPNNGLYAPELTQDQIKLIPTGTKKNGGIWYNKDTDNLEAVVNDVVQIVQVGPGGQGDVVGPNGSVKGNIAIFDNTTGKLIADSGVDIAKVPSPLSFLKSSESLDAPNVTVNEIGNLGHVKFINDVGLIFVDSLMPVEFITNSFGGDEQVCSLFTGGLPSSSTSPSALVELQSDSGALLLSRMTTTERNTLSVPSGSNGMLLFNSTSKTFDGYDGTNWRALPQLNTDGTLTAADPVVSANLTTKKYVDTAIIAVPTTVTLTGAVTGSGAVGTSISTTLTNINTSQITNFNAAVTAFRLDQFAIPTSNISLNSKKITSLLDPTLAQDAATKNYVDTSTLIAPATAKYIIQTANATLTNAQVLGALTTGLLKNTTTTGVLSIAIAGTDYYSPGNPTRIIDTGITGTPSNNFFIGTNAGNLTLTLSPNTGVGINALASLTTGHSNVSVGYNSQTATTSGTYNTSVGRESLFLNVIGLRNSAFGYQSLYNNTASDNTAFGSTALRFNTSGTRNSAFGTETLTANTTGINNSSFGYQALTANTTGQDNNGFGFGVLFLNQTGSYNNAFGSGVLSSNISGANNTGFGHQALYANTAGGNSAFGYSSLYSNTTGASNSAFGWGSGSTQSIYNNCTFLGQSADASVNNLTNAIAIGYQSSVSASNCMVLGGSSGNQLSVGIGITPNAQFQLPTIHANRKIVLYETANNDHQVFGLGTAAGIFRFQIDNTTSSYIWNAAASSSTSTELMRLTGAGNLGIGASTVNGQLQLGNTVANRKIVLYEAANNDHQYFGFGVNAGALRFQTGSVGDGYIFYAATSTSASNELMRLTGGGVLYAKQSYAQYYSTSAGVGTVITTVNVFQKLSIPNGTSSWTNFSYASSRLTYSGLNTIQVTITVSIKASYTGGVAGEISTYAIVRSGTTIAQMPSPITSNTEQLATLTSASTISNGDYFEIWGTHNTGSGTRTVVINNINISISST